MSSRGCPGPTQRHSALTYSTALSVDIIEVEVTAVPDVLIRDVPEEVLAALDARAARLGLSRSEYLRRRLAQEATNVTRTVTVSDLSTFAATFIDLDDPDVMAGAWR